MGKNRTINTKMWSDRKVTDKFSTEDKLMWLYLLTNDNINNLGCYKVSISKMGFDTGFTKNTIENILIRFMDYHDVIMYDIDTSEILIKNYNRYNWTSSPTYRKSLENLLTNVESKNLKQELDEIIKEFYGDIQPKKPPIPFDITSEQELDNEIKQVIDRYNLIMNGRLTYKNKATNESIRARLNEGYNVDDFDKVISFKKDEWIGTDMAKYLVPSTLFSPSKFSNYLIQSDMGMSGKSKANRDKANDDALWSMLEN